jgi:hypothetical protein
MTGILSYTRWHSFPRVLGKLSDQVGRMETKLDATIELIGRISQVIHAGLTQTQEQIRELIAAQARTDEKINDLVAARPALTRK